MAEMIIILFHEKEKRLKMVTELCMCLLKPHGSQVSVIFIRSSLVQVIMRMDQKMI